MSDGILDGRTYDALWRISTSVCKLCAKIVQIQRCAVEFVRYSKVKKFSVENGTSSGVVAMRLIYTLKVEGSIPVPQHSIFECRSLI